jgi:hypothetical protein
MSQSDSTLLVAVFVDPYEARACMEELRQSGFGNEQLGCVLSEHEELDREEVTEHSMAAEGSVVGAFAGAGLGGLWGIGMAAGLLPVVGPILAGGMLASIVVTAATGAALGSLTGALVGLGVPESEAAIYEQELHRGNVVVTVRAGDRRSMARDILEKHNATVRLA